MLSSAKKQGSWIIGLQQAASDLLIISLVPDILIHSALKTSAAVFFLSAAYSERGLCDSQSRSPSPFSHGIFLRWSCCCIFAGICRNPSLYRSALLDPRWSSADIHGACIHTELLSDFCRIRDSAFSASISDTRSPDQSSLLQWLDHI